MDPIPPAPAAEASSRRHAPDLASVRAGAILTLPMMPGLAFFGATFGAVAAQKGLTFLEALLMTSFVFAGAAQLAAMEVWSGNGSLLGLLTIVSVVGLVNLRFFLVSASLRPQFAGVAPRYVYPQLLVLTDMNYLIAMRHKALADPTPGELAGALAGAGLTAWSVWVLAAAPGYLVSGLIADPRAYGLDMLMPVTFAAMAVGVWRATPDRRPWFAAGAAALAVSAVAPGHWHIIAGAAAGMTTAALTGKDAA